MLSRLEAFAEPEISQFDFPVAEEYILRLDISVHNVVFIKYFESFKDLSEGLQCFLLRECSFSLDDLMKIAPIAVLIDKIIVVSGLKMILISDNILTGCDGGERVDLIDGTLF